MKKGEKEYIIKYEQKPIHLLVCLFLLIFFVYLFFLVFQKYPEITSTLELTENFSFMLIMSLIGWVGSIIILGYFIVSFFNEMLKAMKYSDYGELWKREKTIFGNIIEIKELIPPREPKSEDFRVKYKTIFDGRKGK